jgi:hypothetical protein
MRITFDTNTFDKASRPTIYPQNPELQEMIVVHEALKHGEIQGFISDTAITLEGITNDQRAAVFGSTQIRSSRAQTAEDTFTITIRPDQVDRAPLHPKQGERFIEAFNLGIRLLGVPRFGMTRAEEQFYAAENPAMLGERLNRFFDILNKIEARGLGIRRHRELPRALPEERSPKALGSRFSERLETFTRRARLRAPLPNGRMLTALRRTMPAAMISSVRLMGA